jgi:hypothetical protein
MCPVLSKGHIQQPVSLSGPTLRAPTDNFRDAWAAPPGMSPIGVARNAAQDRPPELL